MNTMACSIPCSAPYIPAHAFVDNPRLNYNFGDRVTVTCNTTSRTFALQCHNKGLWSGPIVTCPEPVTVSVAAPTKCSAPSIPRYSTFGNLQLNYNHGERVTVRCDNNTVQPFDLRCETTGLWTGSVQSCPPPAVAPVRCSAPYVPRYASIDSMRLAYNLGDSVTVTCDTRTDRSYTLQCNSDGFWTGRVMSCPQPTEEPMQCSAPYIPKYATVEGLRLNYNYGERLTVICDTSTDRFTLQCHTRGLWNGPDVSCPEPIDAPSQCSAPALPRHSTIEVFQMNYQYGDNVAVICDASSARFTLQCNNDGLWSGPTISCPEPSEDSIPCSAPYVPHHSTVQDLRLNYNFGDRVNVTCDASDGIFVLQCHNKGLWSGPVVSCPEPNAGDGFPHQVYCSAPAVPHDSTIQYLRLTYKDGDRVNVTCMEGPGWFDLLCDDGMWTGQNVVCPDPVIECNPPIIPAVSSVDNLKPRYKIDDEVNITCNDASGWFVWECKDDGLWQGQPVNCPSSPPLTAGTPAGRIRNVNSTDSQDGRNILITGLLVAAVIMFILVLMSMVAFSISFKSIRSSGSSKDGLRDGKACRGPLPDVPEGYQDYLVGDKSLYAEPYPKPNDLPYESYEPYEKPV